MAGKMDLFGPARFGGRMYRVDALSLTQHAPDRIGAFWTLYGSRRFVIECQNV
jgi:hypothetical protein